MVLHALATTHLSRPLSHYGIHTYPLCSRHFQLLAFPSICHDLSHLSLHMSFSLFEIPLLLTLIFQESPTSSTKTQVKCHFLWDASSALCILPFANSLHSIHICKRHSFPIAAIICFTQLPCPLKLGCHGLFSRYLIF